MKHPLDESQLLRDMCAELHLDIPVTLADELLVYLDRLLIVNESMNLTRITEREAAIRLHVLDSLSALPEVLSAPAGRLCDIGTGGGFPGLPLALASGRAAVLLDSVAKKAVAVEGLLGEQFAVREIHAVAARAEQHAREFPAHYAVVSARAVAPLPSLVELAAPLLSDSGLLVALKGSPEAEEIAAGDRACEFAGMTRVSIREFVLPGGSESRTVIAYCKTGKPRTKLPRREGLAQHSPLG